MADSHRAPGFARGSRAGSPPPVGPWRPVGSVGGRGGCSGGPAVHGPPQYTGGEPVPERCAADAGGGVRPPGGVRPGRTVPSVPFTVCPREDFCICRCSAGPRAGARPPPIRPPGGRGEVSRRGPAPPPDRPGGSPSAARRASGAGPSAEGAAPLFERCSGGAPTSFQQLPSANAGEQTAKAVCIDHVRGAAMAFCGLYLAAGRSVRRGRRGGRANHMVGSRPFRGRRTPLPGRFCLPSGAPGGARPQPLPAFWPGKSQFAGCGSGVGAVAGGRKTVQPVWY